MGLSNLSTSASKVASGTPYYFFLETFLNSLKTLLLFCMSKCFACMMYVHNLRVLYLRRLEEDMGSSKTGVIERCKIALCVLEMNLVFLEEWPMFTH